MAYTIVTFGSDGKVSNPDVLSALLKAPFIFQEIFIFSHGWWTSADAARDEYTKFSDGLTTCLQSRRSSLANAPGDTARVLALGIHWPSMVSEHPGVFTDIFEAFSYADMRALAERVAGAGITQLVRNVWQFAAPDRRLRIHVLGHSMGCRVACVALSAALLAEAEVANPSDPASAPWVKIGPNVVINVVLFQGAIDNNTLQVASKYGALANIPGLRVLVTRSDLDLVLKDYPPDVGTNPALGATGPTPATFTDATSQFNQPPLALPVGAGLTCSDIAGMSQRFVVADLTQLHQYHGNGPNNVWGGLSGHHSDISCPETYELVAGFLFG